MCEGKDVMIAAKDQEIAAQQKIISDETKNVKSLADECASLKGSLEGKAEKINILEAQSLTLKVRMMMDNEPIFHVHLHRLQKY